MAWAGMRDGSNFLRALGSILWGLAVIALPAATVLGMGLLLRKPTTEVGPTGPLAAPYAPAWRLGTSAARPANGPGPRRNSHVSSKGRRGIKANTQRRREVRCTLGRRTAWPTSSEFCSFRRC